MTVISNTLPVPKSPYAIAGFGLSWPLLVGATCYLLALNRGLLVDPDTYWHLAAARWMFEHLAIPATDPFSHTMPGASWVAHEWLSEILLGISYQLAGWNGPVMLAAAAYGLTLSLVCRYLLRHLEPIYALCFTVLAAFMAADYVLARPHALAFPLMVAWIIVLLRAREKETTPALPWVFLMTVWANLHGSFPLGLGLVVFFAVEATVEAVPGKRREMVIAWGYFAFSTLLASMLTPHGFRGLMFAVHVDAMSYAMSTISEWRSLNFQKLQPLEVSLMAGAMLVFLRGLRLPPLRAVLLLGLLHLALAHGRHGAVFGLLAPMIVARFMGEQWRLPSPTSNVGQLDRWFAEMAANSRLVAIATICLVLAGISYGVARSGYLRPNAAITPESAIRAAQAANPPGKVLNFYNFGGYLIFTGIPPAIDGRADMYGDAFLAAYDGALRLKEPDRFIEMLERYDIGWTLLVPGLPAVALLDRLPGWHRLYADEVAVVHVRVHQK